MKIKLIIAICYHNNLQLVVLVKWIVFPYEACIWWGWVFELSNVKIWVPIVNSWVLNMQTTNFWWRVAEKNTWPLRAYTVYNIISYQTIRILQIHKIRYYSHSSTTLNIHSSSSPPTSIHKCPILIIQYS